MTFVDPSGTTYFRTAEDNAGCAEGDDLCLFAGDDRFSLEDRAALTCSPNLDPLSSWFARLSSAKMTADLDAADAVVGAMVNKANQARAGGSDLAAAALAAYQTGSEQVIRRAVARRAQELTIEWLWEPDRDKAAALLREVDTLSALVKAGVMDDRRTEEEARIKKKADAAAAWAAEIAEATKRYAQWESDWYWEKKDRERLCDRNGAFCSRRSDDIYGYIRGYDIDEKYGVINGVFYRWW